MMCFKASLIPEIQNSVKNHVFFGILLQYERDIARLNRLYDRK